MYIQNVTVGRILKTSRVCLFEVCTVRSVKRDDDETTSSDWVCVCVCVLVCCLYLCFVLILAILFRVLLSAVFWYNVP